MPFSPKPEYITVTIDSSIKDFFQYKELFVTRPPYQRKSVWNPKKKKDLMDSLFRGYYIPKLVMRDVRLSETKKVSEIIDGQQRITTVQDFFDNKFPLPNTLENVDENLPGKYYENLDADTRKFIDRELKFQIDVIKNIDDPENVRHQMIATDIFWRLQQGETLNYMEVAHAKLSSLTRNFIVKYADDETFDYDEYHPVDNNPDKLPFFNLLNVDNIRMKHLQFMARFVMIERGDGYADLGNKEMENFINEAESDNGIGNFSFENEPEAKATINTLKIFHSIFENDPMLSPSNGIKELSVEYFIISIYLLIRHLRRYYVIDEESQKIIKEFIYYFHGRWKRFYEMEDDNDILTFSNRRQQGERDLEVRDMILRQIFFEYLRNNDKELTVIDGRRAFSELERIMIYRRGKGLCQECLREEKPESEAIVPWVEYHADHVIPHSKGGKTELENAQLLCRYHNQSKGNKTKES